MEWKELGRVGRLGLVGMAFAAVLAVGLGYRIENVARSDLLRNRAAVLSRVIDSLPGDITDLRPGTAEFREFDTAVSRRLLGGETVRVKVWTPDGTVVYSDVPQLIGQTFDAAPDRLAAFNGEFSHDTADLDGPENIYDRELGGMIEFYLPVRNPTGDVIVAFEIYQNDDSLLAALSEIRAHTWWSVGLGLFAMAAFTSGLTFGMARALNRRRRAAEALAASVVTTREEERRRLVTALHDDVSQPLYRILFGLQGCRQRLTDQPVRDELERLEGLAREIEVSIRTELRSLHGSIVQEMGLSAAIEQLVTTTMAETDLSIHLKMDRQVDMPSLAVTSAIYRAVKESVFNIRRHADASTIEIKISHDGCRMTASVSDDGVGWNGAEGIGLATTRQILRSVNGELEITLRRPRGTHTLVEVPYSKVST